jgi:hypothetical protein
LSECYRCQTITAGTGDPVGVCDMCSSFACASCGTRIPGLSLFRCAICWPAVLVTSAGIAPWSGGGPGGGSGAPVGPTSPSGGGGGGTSARIFDSTDEFEALVPTLANESGISRYDWRKNISDVVLSLHRVHEGGKDALDQLVHARKADTQEEPNVAMLSSLPSGLVVASQVSDAEDRGELNRDLFADALGVASWAINVAVGEQPRAERLALINDPRVTFVIGFMSPAFA